MELENNKHQDDSVNSSVFWTPGAWMSSLFSLQGWAVLGSAQPGWSLREAVGYFPKLGDGEPWKREQVT